MGGKGEGRRIAGSERIRPIPVYRFKDTLLHGLHPAAAAFLIGCLAFCVLFLDHPLYTLSLVSAVVLLAAAAESGAEIRPYLRLALIVGAFIFLVNPLVNHQGEHVLVYGPSLPVLGRMDITLEAVFYGASAGLEVFTVILLFGLAGLLINPDDVLSMLAGRAFRSSLAAALAVRLYPTMAVEAGNLREVQLVRGVPLEGGGRWERVKAHLPLWYSLFRGSLDRAAGLAESMAARGFGSRRRAYVRRTPLRPRDWVIIFLAAAISAGACIAALQGGIGYRYFPSPDPLPEGWNPLISLLFVVAAAFLFLLSRSWRRWHWLRSKV